MQLPIIVGLMFLWLTAQSQNSIFDHFSTKDGLIVYSGIVEVDSSLKAVDLYLNAKSWLVDAFKSSKAVIEIDEKEARVIAIKAYIQKYVSYVKPKIWYTLKLEIKDGRYRYTLSDTNVEYDVSLTMPPTHFQSSLENWISEAENKQATKKWEMKANEDWRSQLNTLCIDIDLDFKAIIRALEKSMRTKSNKDW